MGMLICQSCGQTILESTRFCTKCGHKIGRPLIKGRETESLNLRVLYIMVGLLILAVLFPPWEAGPEGPPEFLGFHFILSPPRPDAVISRVLQTVQLFTIAVAHGCFETARNKVRFCLKHFLKPFFQKSLKMNPSATSTWLSDARCHLQIGQSSLEEEQSGRY